MLYPLSYEGLRTASAQLTGRVDGIFREAGGTPVGIAFGTVAKSTAR
jgi:hypothetical protein